MAGAAMIISAEISVEELAQELVHGSREELIALVKRLDEIVGEWHFTLQLADYFEGLRKTHAQEREDEDGQQRRGR